MQRPGPRNRILNRDPRNPKVSTSVSSWLNFNPLSLSPQLWLDAADTSTITESSGAVSQWDDKSGNGRNFVQATGANQPETGTNFINGLNTVYFNNKVMTLSDTVAMRPNSLTIVMVVETQNLSGRRDFFCNGAANAFASNNWIVGTNGSALDFLGRTPASVVSGGTVVVNKPYFWSWVHTSAAVSGFSNRVSMFSNVTSTVGTDNISGTFLGRNNLGTAGIISKIGEILFFDRELTRPELESVQGYFQNKWGIIP
jgi:hypothetical protein